MATWGHLVRRFLGSLRPGGPSAEDERWALDALAPAEAELWARMSGADRRHAVGVARVAVAELAGRGHEASGPVRAAALLHDVGKVESGLGPFRRAVVTVAGMAAGHPRARRWSTRAGPIGRAGRYLCHDEVGARLLSEASSDPLTVAWAREHHLPVHRWSVPGDLGAVLKAADDD